MWNERETYVQSFRQIPSSYVTTLDSTRVNLEEIDSEDVNSIELAEDSIQRLAFMMMPVKFQASHNENFMSN
jgi:hypothetical protein